MRRPASSFLRALFGVAVGTSTLVCASPPARGDEPDPDLQPPVVVPTATAAPAPARTPRWYGYQSLAVDALAVPLLFVGTAEPNAAAALLGGLAYLVAGPIVHGVHRNGGAAGASLVLRLLMPLAGGFAGANIAEKDSCAYCGVGGFAYGLVVGAGVASIIDGIALGYESPARPAVAPPPRASSLSFSPVVSPRREGGVVFGLSASF